MTKVAEDIQHIYDSYQKNPSNYQELQANKEKKSASKWKLFNNVNSQKKQRSI